MPERPPDEDNTTANPRLFIWFRIFFNCRFYYPVYAILFLDFGLNAAQFAWLNVAWAVSIVLLEVPSGALADQLGRRTLVISAAVLMVIEMLVLCAMPVIDPALAAADPEAGKRALGVLFLVFCVNRVISGAAEAAASGADEALAYDSLDAGRRDTLWSRLTVQLMKWQSVGFIAVTLIGAAVYDPDVVNAVSGWLGSERRFTQSETLKFPIYLTFGMALATLVTALRFREPASMRPKCDLPLPASVRRSFRRTFAAGGWILRTPAALMLILVGLFYDSIVRLYYTVGSLWLETIGYEPRWFGVISVAGSLTGILSATVGARLMARHGPDFNFRLLTALIFVPLVSLAFPVRHWSVLFLPGFWLAMRLLHFFLSNYLNRVTDSENRATVLSFRGLTMNLSYGLVTWIYGLQTGILREKLGASEAAAPPPGSAGTGARDALSGRVFAEAVSWWWLYFAVVLAGLWLFRRTYCRKSWGELLDP